MKTRQAGNKQTARVGSLRSTVNLPVSGWPRDVIELHVNVFNVKAVAEKSDSQGDEQEEEPVREPVQQHGEKSHFFPPRGPATSGEQVNLNDHLVVTCR